MECFSRQMSVAGRREIRSIDGPRLAELLACYEIRGGPGLTLTEAEITGRINCHLVIHFLKAAYSMQCIKEVGCIPTKLSTVAAPHKLAARYPAKCVPAVGAFDPASARAGHRPQIRIGRSRMP